MKNLCVYISGSTFNICVQGQRKNIKVKSIVFYAIGSSLITGTTCGSMKPQESGLKKEQGAAHNTTGVIQLIPHPKYKIK